MKEEDSDEDSTYRCGSSSTFTEGVELATALAYCDFIFSTMTHLFAEG
jgi:hypothetical protein